MEKKKKIYMLIAIFLALLLVFFVVLGIRNYMYRKNYDPTKQYQTVKEALEALNCTYIKEKKSDLENVAKDIYLKFRVDLYTPKVYVEPESNEKEYQTIVYTLANTLGYENYRLIDEEKKIVILVSCDKEKKEVLRMYINGDDNYFGNTNSSKAIEEYVKTENTQLNIQSSYLRQLIEKDWQTTKMDFGKEIGKEGKYTVYDTGVKVRSVNKKVFNILFTQEYKEEVVNHIKVKTDIVEIRNTLGPATFNAVSEGVIGYKNEQIYVFFTNEEISIYRVENLNKQEEFLQIIQDFVQDRDVQKLTDTVTDVWQDYDFYEFDKDHIDLRYSLKGVAIQFNVTGNHGIIFFNNYTGKITDTITLENLKEDQDKLPDVYHFSLTSDLVFENEIERVVFKE